MPLNFQKKEPLPVTRTILVVLVVASIALCTVYAREGSGGFLHTMQNTVHALVAPLGFLGEGARSGVDAAGQTLSDATASEETLSELRARNAELTELVTQGEEYRLEAERLQGLLGLKDAYRIEGVSGRVIGKSTDAWNQTLTVDVGSADGVETGLTVMGPSGVIGQVVAVNPGSCTVRLLTDPQSGAAAIVQASRAEGVVRGSLSGVLHLENIEADVELSVGDVVLTSGLGGSYVRGLLIGTIVRVEGNESDGVRTVVVAPNEQTATLEEVMVVFSAQGVTSTSTPPASASDGGQPASSSASSASSASSSGADAASSASARSEEGEG